MELNTAEELDALWRDLRGEESDLSIPVHLKGLAEEKFFISSWKESDGRLEGRGVPYYQVKEISSKSAIGPGVRVEQALRNCKIVNKRVQRAPRHDRRAIIIGYGPSLHDTWQEIAREKRSVAADIVTTSGAHDFLIGKGIVPDFHVEVDPREYKARYTEHPHEGVRYQIASSCHPVMIDRLKDYDLSLFHTYNSEEEMQLIAPDGPDPGGWLIAGGGTAVCRAVNLKFMEGYRSFSLYGADCSFSTDGAQNAGDRHGKAQKEFMGKVNGRWFRTSAAMIATARGFLENWNLLVRACEANKEPMIPGLNQRIEMILHGDGMLQEMAKASGDTGII